MDKFVYVIGSLRQQRPRTVSNDLRGQGFEVFDDWHAQGELADDYWQAYEKARGRTYREALAGKAACHAFEFDYNHLITCSACVLVYPAGKSAHMELGFVVGRHKPGIILLNGEPGTDERWELMVKLATAICYTTEEVVAELRKVGL